MDTCTNTTTMDRALLPTLALMILAPCAVLAQTGQPRDFGSKALDKESVLVNKKQYREALDLYASVHPSDTVYETVLLRRSALELDHGDRAKAMALFDEGIKLKGEYAANFMMLKALGYAQEKQYPEALAVLDSTIREFPGLFRPRGLRANMLKDMGDHAAHLEALKDNVRHFPLIQDNHIELAEAARREGNISQAALATFTALIVQWGGESGPNVLSYAEQLLSGSLRPEPLGVDLGAGDDFKELDLLLRNKVAMNKSYKMTPKLDYAFVRQGHFLLNALNDRSQGTGFWSTYYVPFMNDLMRSGLFEGFCYHALSNAEGDKVKALVAKNQKSVAAFRPAAYKLLKQHFLNFPDSVGGEWIAVDHYFNDDGNLEAYGAGGSYDTPVGPWVTFGKNGRPVFRGEFNSAHERIGVSENYHPDGSIRLRQHWKNGMEHGPWVTWYPNGMMKDSVNVVEGKANGLHVEYSRYGALTERKNLVDGKLNGEVTAFYPCGTVEYEGRNVDGELDGPVTTYYPDGKKKAELEFKAGELTGKRLEYGREGQLLSDYSWANGKREGPFTRWYPHGQKEEEGSLTNNMLTGKQSTWSEGGILTDEEYRDAKGEATGTWVRYAPQGFKLSEWEFKRDKLVGYRYFNAAGDVLIDGKPGKGVFDIQGFHPSGAKRMQGRHLESGKKDGTWNWWYPDGTLEMVENMKEGVLEGTQTSYTTSGKLYLEKQLKKGRNAVGPFTRYYPDGSASYKGWLNEDDLDGEQWKFFPNGTAEEREYYVAGDLDGWQEHYDPDGVIVEKVRYQDGGITEQINYDAQGNSFEHLTLQSGEFLWREHYPDGTLRLERPCVNGVRHGTTKLYYPDGTKASEFNYLNGELHGMVKYWFPNGKPSYEVNYEMSQRHGAETRWDRDGWVEMKGAYKYGKRDGYTIYYPNGKAAMERPQRFGKDHGEVRVYDPTGQLQLVRYFTDGELTAYSYNGPDGKLVEPIKLGPDSARLEPKYPNGSPSRLMAYRNGSIQGEYREYHANGQLQEESTFDAGDRVGTSTIYYADGQMEETGEWSNNMKQGEYAGYWPNGKLKYRETYVYGTQHGPTLWYDKTGKLIMELTYRNDEVVGIKRY